MVGTTVPVLPDKQHTAASNQYFPAPTTNMWPGPDFQPLPTPTVIQAEPPQSQIIGDLPHMQLPASKQHPPFVTKDHYNSLLFLSRLLRTQDNLSSRDIIAMQKSEPLFSQIFNNIEKHSDYKLDKNGILFILITPTRGPKYLVLFLPA